MEYVTGYIVLIDKFGETHVCTDVDSFEVQAVERAATEGDIRRSSTDILDSLNERKLERTMRAAMVRPEVTMSAPKNSVRMQEILEARLRHPSTWEASDES